jgi:hypothetical protein
MATTRVCAVPRPGAVLPACYDLALLGAEISRGEVAQLVEHVTENHGVDSSILSLATPN